MVMWSGCLIFKESAVNEKKVTSLDDHMYFDWVLPAHLARGQQVMPSLPVAFRYGQLQSQDNPS